MFDLIATAVGASIIGTTIICNIINATCYKSIELLTNTITKEVAGFDDVDNLIKKTDLLAKIKKINIINKNISPSNTIDTSNQESCSSLCKNISNLTNSSNSSNPSNPSNPSNLSNLSNPSNPSNIIEQALFDLNDIIKELNETIITIDEMKEYQRTLYLNNWKIRAPNLTFILDKLKIEIDILNIRFDDFIKITNIYFMFPLINNSPPKYNE